MRKYSYFSEVIYPKKILWCLCASCITIIFLFVIPIDGNKDGLVRRSAPGPIWPVIPKHFYLAPSESLVPDLNISGCKTSSKTTGNKLKKYFPLTGA
jgi:hypothetical protein